MIEELLTLAASVQNDDRTSLDARHVIQNLSDKLKRADEIINEMNGHEGAEGWSEYLKVMLREWEAYE